jgi:hypothetical protein
MRPYRLSLLTALFPGVFSIGSAQVGGAKHEARTRTSGHFTIRPDSVPWGVPPAVMFTGSPSEGAGGQWRYALLQGDPMKPGAPFTIRFSCGDGDKASPAWHPTDENFVVLKGTFGIGTGDKFEPTALRDLTAGSYGFMPKRMHHFGLCKGESEVLVYGIGPFRVNYISSSGAGQRQPARK